VQNLKRTWTNLQSYEIKNGEVLLNQIEKVKYLSPKTNSQWLIAWFILMQNFWQTLSIVIKRKIFYLGIFTPWRGVLKVDSKPFP